VAAGPAAIRAAAGGGSKTIFLAAGHHLRRGLLPNEKRLLPIEPRHRFRPTVFNILKKDKSKLSLKLNRLTASVNPSFRTALLTR
jgi:hypothetical protein